MAPRPCPRPVPHPGSPSETRRRAGSQVAPSAPLPGLQSLWLPSCPAALERERVHRGAPGPAARPAPAPAWGHRALCCPAPCPWQLCSQLVVLGSRLYVRLGLWLPFLAVSVKSAARPLARDPGLCAGCRGHPHPLLTASRGPSCIPWVQIRPLERILCFLGDSQASAP